MLYFDQPAFFWLLLILGALLVCAVMGKVSHAKELSSWIAPRLKNKLHQGIGNANYYWQLGLLSLIILALITGLAKPILDEQTIEVNIEQQDVCLIIDTSKSMEVRDVTVPRIEQAKLIAHDIISHLPHSRMSIIAFAGDAFTLAPFTQDHQALKNIISQIDTDIIGSQGSSTEQLFKNIKKLQKHYANEPLVILISDGEWHDDSPLKKMINDLPIQSKWLTIGIGSEKGDLIPSYTDPSGYLKDANNYTILSRLNAEKLRSLAKLSSGSYLENPSTKELLATLEKTLKQTQYSKLASEKVSIKSDAVFACLTIALILLLIYMLKPLLLNQQTNQATKLSIGLFFAILCGFSTQHADASVLFKPSASKTLYQASLAYYQQDFKTAYKKYSQALTYDEASAQAEAYQGLSSTLYQQGWQQLDAQVTIQDTQGVSAEKLVEKIQKTMQMGQISPEQLQLTRQFWEDALIQLDQAPEPAKTSNQTIIKQLLEVLQQQEDQQQQQNQDQQDQQNSDNQESQDDQNSESQENQDQQNSDDSSEDGDSNENKDEAPEEENKGESGESDTQQESQPDNSETKDYQETSQQEASQEQIEQAEKLLEQFADMQKEAPKNSELKKVNSRNQGKNY